MTQKVPVKCDCKARNRCTTGSCICIQAKVKCSIACHTSMGSHPDIRDPCPNISAMRDFTSKGLASREENALAKRKRTAEGAAWIARRAKAQARIPDEGVGEGRSGGEGRGGSSDGSDSSSDGRGDDGCGDGDEDQP